MVHEPLLLWPPNNKYQTIHVEDFVLDVQDECSLVTLDDIQIVKVSSDEPVDQRGGGDGNTLDDIVIGQDCQSVDLRVERQGSGNGRVYTISMAVTDENGNESTADYKVHVPKSSKKTAVDDGAAYTVSGCGNENARIAGTSPIEFDENVFDEILIYPNPVREFVTVELP